MTDLSPQAQAVLDAVGDLYESDIPEDRDIMIATLCAAADQVVPACSALSESGTKQLLIRHELLAIAAELKGKGNG